MMSIVILKDIVSGNEASGQLLYSVSGIYFSEMIVKITAIVLITLIVRSTGKSLWDDHLTISWDRDPRTHFYHIPTTSEDALCNGWTVISSSDLNLSKGMEAFHYKNDPTIILLCHHKKVIGVQCAYLVSDIEFPGQPLRWDQQELITRRTLNGMDFYTARVYFFHNRATDTRRIWFEGKSGMREIPTDTSKLLATTPYLKKNCIPAMGTHYYAWDSTSECSTLIPWAVLAINKTVVGVSFQGFGNLTVLGPRVWGENIPRGIIRLTVPDAPNCVIDADREYGLASIHTWFIKYPQNITCQSQPNDYGK